MKKITIQSIGFMTMCILILGDFFQVHALSVSWENTSHPDALGAVPLQTQAITDNFDNFDGTFWESGYVWGTEDPDAGDAKASNISIVKDKEGSYLCLQSPGANNVGAITSVNQFGYGTYTARIKYTASNGTWPAFWALNDPASWEIDALESLGNDPARYYMTIHDQEEIGQGVYDNGESLVDQWHTYSFVWTDTDVTFYFDNAMMYSRVYSRPELVTVMFTMGIMGNGVIWDDNKYDTTTFANGTPTLCVDYFSYKPSSVSDESPLTSTTEIIYDDTDSALVYSPGWQDVSRRQAYEQSYKTTNKNSASVSLAFTGQSFSIVYTGGSTYRKMNVFVDGILVGTINEKASKSTFQRQWDYAGLLSTGIHTLKLVFVTTDKSNKTNGSIDAIIIH